MTSFLDLSSSPPEGDDFLDWEEEFIDRSITPKPGRSGSSTPRNRIDTMKEAQIPNHPIPSMRGAFAESFLDANQDNPIPANRPGTAAARRKVLLEQDLDEETHAGKWKQRPGQKYHELWKLMAQISFGIYLLLNGIAKDEEQVLKILQAHVNEVDDFLETTMEDFNLAQDDIDERLRLLKLPLENVIVFDAMLEDRNFRLQIVGGNENIEHVITRTAKAMRDALMDVQQGLEACKEFASYLAQEQDGDSWKAERDGMIIETFETMKGNVDGWYRAYVALQTKGNNLGVACVQLGSIVAEMDRRAGEVSRKTRFSVMPPSEPSPPASPPERRISRHMRQSMTKILPTDPNIITPAISATLPAFQMVQDRERTPEPESKTTDIQHELEPTFILKPHTYSPMPSPVPPSEPKFEKLAPKTFQQPVKEPEPQPEMTKRSSLRKRFSLGKKESAPDMNIKTKDIPDEEYWGPRRPVLTVAASASTIHGRQESLATPPSRGLDSAYCSDFEKSSPAPISLRSHQATNSRSTLSRINTLESPPSLAPESINILPSPRSDQHQFFRPVNASPHSPLQRPWTAGPSSPHPLHNYANSSSSNLSNQRPPFNHTHSHTPSVLGNRRGAPSAMGMSMNSEITVGVDENGKKIKKKRSAFGWLKKAFSLSEEEKAAFEERRRMVTDREREYAKPLERKWVDGKRVDGPHAKPRRKPSNVPLNQY